MEPTLIETAEGIIGTTIVATPHDECMARISVYKPRYRGFEVVSKYESEKDSIKMPRRSTKESAGYDIYNNTGEDIVLQPNSTSGAISTKLKAYCRYNEYLSLKVRSGHGFKASIRLANVEGIIDADYYNNPSNEGEMFIKLRNPYDKIFTIPAGEAMAQGIFMQYLIADDDAETVGGDRVGGLGSTSK